MKCNNMEKKVLLKDLVETGRNIRKQIISRVVCTDRGVYPIGELWDANKIINTIVAGASTAQDTLKEVEDKLNDEINRAKAAEKNLADTKQDNLVSGTNIKTIANQSILGEGNIDIQAIPANVSYFNNDAGYLTSHQDLTSIVNRIEALELAAGINQSEPGEQ